MVLLLVSGRARPDHAAEAEEFVHTVGTYFPGAELYADEFGPVSQLHFLVPFDSLAAYEEQMERLRQDPHYLRLWEDGLQWFDTDHLEFRVLRQLSPTLE